MFNEQAGDRSFAAFVALVASAFFALTGANYLANFPHDSAAIWGPALLIAFAMGVATFMSPRSWYMSVGTSLAGAVCGICLGASLPPL
ncbi:MAG: hypothetical protein PHH13_03235 [Candidatus Peribacteraceae bacterium]|nr:hypothetical protein [Candidatus Peribacteraceae bacterium]